MTRKDEQTGQVPDWLVERLAAGDLPAARAAEVRRRLELESHGAQRLERIATSNAEILAAHPPSVMAEEIRRRTGGPDPRGVPAATAATDADAAAKARRADPRRWIFGLGTPTLALAALGLALWLRTGGAGHLGGQAGPGPGPGAAGARLADEGDAIKGLLPGLRVYRKVGEAVERLPSGATAHAGDQLQLAYIAAGRRFGAVASVDGAGQVTFHLPAAAGPAARLRTEGEIALADAYELDAAPGFERFVFVAATVAFDASALPDIMRGTAAAPAGAVVVTFTVRKE